jgi:CRP/FNR family cyclic AMP-dependent transcriptional regulator
LQSAEIAGRVMRQDLPFDARKFLTVVAEGRTVSTYKKNQIVFRQEDPADCVFYIQSGKAKISVTSEQGKEAVVALLNQGDFFGEGCLSGHKLRLATATTMTECKITRVAKADIVKVIHSEPAFSEFFIAYLLARNSQTEADLVDQLFNSSEKRLARALLVLANFGKDGESDPVLAKISQKTLAEMVGTTLPRINYFMNKFRRLGLIDYNGSITVHRSLLDLVLRETPSIKG